MSPSPLSGQKMPFFKVKFEPAFNDFTVSTTMLKKNEALRADISHDLSSIHVKPFAQFWSPGPLRLHNRLQKVFFRPRRHGAFRCCKNQNNPPIPSWPPGLKHSR